MTHACSLRRKRLPPVRSTLWFGAHVLVCTTLRSNSVSLTIIEVDQTCTQPSRATSLRSESRGPALPSIYEDPGSAGRSKEMTYWHVEHRGRSCCPVTVTDAPSARDLGDAAFALTGTPEPPPTGSWQLAKTFAAPRWPGGKAHRCYLWQARTEAAD